jgi:ubiquinone/menaquinone biosynthesis C-methylase UbiE
MMAQAAQRCAGFENVTIQQAEGANLPFAEDTFDFVFAIRVTNQTESQEYALEMLCEMVRVTRRRGLILVEFVNRRRPFAKPSRDVRLSFDQIRNVARQTHCDVLSQTGVLVFSQSALDRIPDSLLPLWGRLERLAAAVLWRWASRGYVLLRKR